MTGREFQARCFDRYADDVPPTDPEIVSEFVAAPDAEAAGSIAKADLIERGRAPGSQVHVEDYGDGTYEVLFTDRPLRRDQSWAGTVRVGHQGTAVR